MRKTSVLVLLLLFGLVIVLSCSRSETTGPVNPSYPAITAAFGSRINPASLLNYANQSRPAYIVKDNTAGNSITDSKATLGRVLFYDKNLSIDNSISCASCHRQEFAFSDTALSSLGVQRGQTGRHSMRLVNARFSVEQRFFWNERAATLEQQTTQPIQDHAEMGFSNQNGRPGIAALLTRLGNINYYKELFRIAYGDETVTETRLQESVAQFIRSIQSFDSKFDAGRSQVANNGQPFPNFTQQENAGKNLFLAPPQFDATGSRTGGGLGCAGCHAPPEFDIDPNSRNNGVIGVITGSGIDIGNTRAPSLRDLLRTDGVINGPMMHTGNFRTLQQVIGHYGTINLAPGNTNLDPRLRPGGNGQRLNLTAGEVDAVVAFLRTLSGTAVYTDPRWSNPFLP